MPKSNSGDPSSDRSKTAHWVVLIFFVTIVLSSLISYVSDEIMEHSTIFVAFVILFLIVLLGVLFDVLGVAVTSADEKPFHSMAARKVPGAQESINLLRKAEKVSSICNDVIGDICGVVSGSASATIAVQVLKNFHFTWPQVVTLAMSAVVAGMTVGGKAIGKTFAIRSCTQIVHFAGRLIYTFKKVPDLFKKKK